MDRKKELEDRLRIEILRSISKLAEYVDRSAIFTVSVMIGAVFVVLGISVYVATLSSLYVAFLISYVGVFIIVSAVWYRVRYKRTFYRDFRRIFEPTLLRSSEYDHLLKDLRYRSERSMKELAKREAELSSREDTLRNLQKEIARLQAEKEMMGRELATSRRMVKKG